VNTLAIVIVVLLVVAIPSVIVGAMFIWAAIRDGRYDQALQRRLGIRRRTRLGP
jgi:nitrogen fixation-related uncharacterized protein